MTAATGCPPPRSVAVHPFGTPSTDNASRSGATSMFCRRSVTLAVVPGRTLTAG